MGITGDGFSEGVSDGIIEGSMEGLLDGTVEGTVDGMLEGTGQSALFLLACFTYRAGTLKTRVLISAPRTPFTASLSPSVIAFSNSALNEPLL